MYVRCVTALLYCAALLCLATILPAAIDSGGGRSTIGAYTNHGSIGEPYETAPGTAGGYGIYLGLIEVLYPPMPVSPDADSDGNGLPDDWETTHFGGTGVDSDGDADNDGTTNEMEMLAKTDPNDPASVFRPASYRDGDNLVVPVQTQTDRAYRIWGSPDLDGWTLLDTIAGDGNLVEWTYPISDPDSLPYFLKVEILLQ